MDGPQAESDPFQAALSYGDPAIRLVVVGVCKHCAKVSCNRDASKDRPGARGAYSACGDIRMKIEAAYQSGTRLTGFQGSGVSICDTLSILRPVRCVRDRKHGSQTVLFEG